MQHLFVHLFKHTYLFSLDVSKLLLACNKGEKVMHCSRIFFKQPQLNLFSNIQEMSDLTKVCSKTTFVKIPCHKEVIEKNFPVLKCFKNSKRCIRFYYVNNRFKDQEIVFATCEEVHPRNVSTSCIYIKKEKLHQQFAEKSVPKVKQAHVTLSTTAVGYSLFWELGETIT